MPCSRILACATTTLSTGASSTATTSRYPACSRTCSASLRERTEQYPQGDARADGEACFVDLEGRAVMRRWFASDRGGADTEVASRAALEEQAHVVAREHRVTGLDVGLAELGARAA